MVFASNKYNPLTKSRVTRVGIVKKVNNRC